jgi:hypothetical protein
MVVGERRHLVDHVDVEAHEVVDGRVVPADGVGWAGDGVAVSIEPSAASDPPPGRR